MMPQQETDVLLKVYESLFLQESNLVKLLEDHSGDLIERDRIMSIMRRLKRLRADTYGLVAQRWLNTKLHGKEGERNTFTLTNQAAASVLELKMRQFAFLWKRQNRKNAAAFRSFAALKGNWDVQAATACILTLQVRK